VVFNHKPLAILVFFQFFENIQKELEIFLFKTLVRPNVAPESYITKDNKFGF